MHLSVGSYHLRACVRCMADALERGFLPAACMYALHGFLPSAWRMPLSVGSYTICEHVCTAWRMRLSVGSYHLRACLHCMADALERSSYHLRACMHCMADALERGFSPSARHVCAAWRIHLSVGSCHLRACARCVADALGRGFLPSAYALHGGCA